MNRPALSYQKFPVPSDIIAGDVWLSALAQDPVWDDFLRGSPLGQYQQSSLWAEFKAGEGWRHHRVVVNVNANVVGGFQILWRKKGPVRIGYVSKGPVALPSEPGLLEGLCRLLRLSARELGLHALIVQLPDESREPDLTPCDFVRSNPMDVIEATYLVNVSEGMEPVRKRMHPKMRQYVRKAREQNLGMRTGSEQDLPLFFKLMCATCQRQQTAPNPGSLDSLRRLWHLFAGSNSAELAFAGRDGHDVAGRMNLIFGNRVTQWKKGWDGTNPNWHANEFLADHALEWAHAQGYRFCDFSAINRLTAEHLLSGKPSDDTIARSRDMFNLRLGGFPRLLPRAHLLLVNPLLRWGYRLTYLTRERRREQELLARRSQRVPDTGPGS